MKILKKLCVLWLWCGVCYTIIAQPQHIIDRDLSFTQPSPEFNLSKLSYNDIVQDNNGYLWFCTWSGLIRYDGNKTIFFNQDNERHYSLKSNQITTIFQDSKNNFWIGTRVGGLYKFVPEDNKFIQYERDLQIAGTISNNNVWRIVEDKRGYLWIATEDGLNRMDPVTGMFTKFLHSPNNPNSLGCNFITGLNIDSKGRIWVSTEHGIDLIANPHSHEVRFMHFTYDEDIVNFELHNYVFEVMPVLIKGKEHVFFCTKLGLKCLVDGQIKNFALPGKVESGDNFFRSIYFISGEKPFMLVGSEKGLNIFDITSEKFLRHYGAHERKSNLNRSSVTCIEVDRSGVLWVGTKMGLYKYDTYAKDIHHILTTTFDPTNNIITGIQGGLDHHIWISTIGGGLYVMDTLTHRFMKILLKESTHDNFSDFIQKLLIDAKSKTIWIGTAGAGVLKVKFEDIDFNSGLIRSYEHYLQKSRTLTHDYVMSMTKAKDGGVWIGTWSGGLNKINVDGSVKYYQDARLVDFPIVDIHEQDNVLWVGTRGNGLYKLIFSKDIITHFSVHQMIRRHNEGANYFVNCIYESKAGTIWVATEHGLNSIGKDGIFDLKKFSSQIDEGEINGILEDHNGKLWLMHSTGIMVVNSTAKDSIIYDLGFSDHVEGGLSYNDISYMDSGNKLYFGGATGFNIIDEKKLVNNPIKPVVALTKFNVFNRPIFQNDTLDGRILYQTPICNLKRIVLKHFESSFGFEFAAFHFAAPQNNRYAYQLVGFDKDWQYSNYPFANYTNIPEGDYTFIVKAANNDGLWNNESFNLEVKVLAPWWKTWWAYCLYGLVLAGVLTLFTSFIIVRTNYVNEIKLERIHIEQLEKLNNANLQFFTNVSHEFRTPLTLILGPLEKIMQNSTNRFIKDQLTIINLNAQRLLRLINQLLDFRKVESGAVKLKIAEGNFIRFTKEIILSFQGMAEQKQTEIVLESSSEEIRIWFDRDQFEKILYNLLSNALKHSKPGGRIKVMVSENCDHMKLIVEDNGDGIDQDEIKQIFDRFYSGDEHMTGVGIGLSLVKSLIQLHSGTINVESKKNEFTRFTITIPRGEEHFHNAIKIRDFKNSEFIENYSHSLMRGLHSMNAPIEQLDSDPQQKFDHTILIVEDNMEVRKFIKDIFIYDYHVWEAENGQQGLEMALELNPDVIVSDIMMPVMDGINLCKQIKSDIHTCHIPVILLTARTSHIFMVDGLETGADDYVTKPFSSIILKLKVKNIICTREKLKQELSKETIPWLEPKVVSLQYLDQQFIERAIQSVEDNMSNDQYGVEDLTRDVAMSRIQLHRKLKALTGQTPLVFIRKLRLKRSAQLMVQNQMNISEVTYHVGFNDLQYFRDCFKKEFKMTPSEYIKRAQDEKIRN